ncbi:hypothetical protein LSTR_LSTR010982 [Laodelphax striatellus]|uniref:Carboxylesterase type B domain-containing protein n=1 Tax=Laodelphax striatellus TaxID=195883 RepID=A0A482X0S9_LAOST|nr:hypothetical protein LSTR_LSTR010982 [Laodelphax striatellus]
MGSGECSYGLAYLLLNNRLDYFWVLLIFATLSELCVALSATRTIHTKYGDISGVIVTPDNRHLDAVEVFKGIPYASPPVGSLRFMPPVTGALWSGVKVADRFSPVCPQRLPDISNETLALKKMPRGRLEYLKRLLPYLKNQSEDCLYLNIYAPAQEEEEENKRKEEEEEEEKEEEGKEEEEEEVEEMKEKEEEEEDEEEGEKEKEKEREEK